jgi:hypothetical protein
MAMIGRNNKSTSVVGTENIRPITVDIVALKRQTDREIICKPNLNKVIFIR